VVNVRQKVSFITFIESMTYYHYYSMKTIKFIRHFTL